MISYVGGDLHYHLSQHGLFKEEDVRLQFLLFMIIDLVPLKQHLSMVFAIYY